MRLRHGIFAIAVCWLGLGLGSRSLQAQNNAPSFSVGIAPFQDVSGNPNLGQLANVLPSMLQSVLLDKTQLVPRQLQGAPSGQAIDVSSAAALGQQSGADVVAIGTLLAGSIKTSNGSFGGFGFHGIQVGGNSKKISVRLLLQVDLVDVNRGVKIATLRARGNVSNTHFDPSMDSGNYGNVNMQSAGFSQSALGKATTQALNRLAKKMVRALKNFHPANAAAPGGPGAPGGGAPAPAPTSPGATPAPAGAGTQPNFKAVKIDFVPGERTIFFDDLSDMAPDEPPPHWKVRGSSVALLISGTARELQVHVSQLTSPPLALPANFTLQSVMTYHIGGDSGTTPTANWHFQDGHGNDVLYAASTANVQDKTLTIRLADGDNGTLGNTTVPNVDFTQPVHVDLWIQNGRVREYVNGARVLDENQVKIQGIAQLALYTNRGEGDRAWIGLQRVRLAESAPDFAAAMQATGKYVTHGIHFDTGSAILKADSAPIVKQVADGLLGDPALNLEIDGYTDSVGGKAANLKLSQARADAVRSVLISQFGIDANRLTAKGMGEADPIGSNDTAAGRAENRRVEFVKQ